MNINKKAFDQPLARPIFFLVFHFWRVEATGLNCRNYFVRKIDVDCGNKARNALNGIMFENDARGETKC